MLFRTHITFSILIFFALRKVLPIPIWVLFFVLFSTAIVDIDIKNSKIGKRWYFRPIQWITKHRGFLHSTTMGILLSLLVASFNKWAGFGFLVGYVSHLFLDCLTKAGVRLFWPIKWKLKGFIKSGGVIEDIFFVIFLLLDILIVAKVIFGYLF